METKTRFVMERKGRIEEMDRSFDLSFWQRQEATARFSAAWDLVVWAAKVKGQDVSQLRLQRTIASFQRLSR
jgi:hypothetical protein